MREIFFILFSAFVFPFSCQSPSAEPEDNSIDLQNSPAEPALFGENIISTPLYERDLAISPQGDEMIYTLGDYKQTRRCLVSVRQINGLWGKPQILNISGTYQDIEPFFNDQGNRLYFASNRPVYGDSSRHDYNIWYSDKVNGSWSDPVPVDSSINTPGDEFFPSLSRKGNLYFTATREDGMGREDIFVAEFADGKFLPPMPLPEEINTLAYEFNAFVSPDEDYIIFSSYGRPDGYGGGDLYISEKDTTGNWTPARNLGEPINSDKLDYCPFVDADHQNFYFTSERKIINHQPLTSPDEIQEAANAIENGFGNIYQVELEALKLKK